LDIKIQMDNEWEKEFLHLEEKEGPWSSFDQYKLGLEAQTIKQIDSFTSLVSLPHIHNLQLHDYQIKTVRHVLEKLNGKAILADEVGLGKTIEAGFILKEYMVRGLIKKAVIFAPASLINQWISELKEKFQLPVNIYKSEHSYQDGILITTIEKAKRANHRDFFLNQSFDMVIVDEAHRLNHPQTQNFMFMEKVKKKYCLFLTATPVQNKVEELYSMISLLKPGLLGTFKEFNKRFEQAKKEPHSDVIQSLVRQVMIRNRRIDTGVFWKERKIKTQLISLSSIEHRLYSQLDSFLHLQPDSLPSLTLKREFCSSPHAFLKTASKTIPQNLTSKKDLENLKQYSQEILNLEQFTKAKALLQLVQSLNSKVIIFTEYRATQLYLQHLLYQNGIFSVLYQGGKKASNKDWTKYLFKEKADVMIATDAGSEGLNLQFCHNMIHYDLPWNPMKLEQRIGRIHRLGQQEDVQLFYLILKDTIEEHILKILYKKVDIFKQLIGDLDEILSQKPIDNLSNLHFDAKEYFC
jgi:SNF2 family DNA or RNA helicase